MTSSISFYEEKQIFKLDTSGSSYIFGVDKGGYLTHYYYGARIADHDVSYLGVREGHDSSVPLSADVDDWRFSPDTVAMEYPCFGTGDYRISALEIKDANGHNSTDFRYRSHKIVAGKKPIPGMPSAFAAEDEAETLELVGTDITGAEVTLYYTVFKSHPVITRRVSVKNASNKPMFLERVYSACVDFTHPEFDMLGLWGCWGRERKVERNKLAHGITSFSSVRGASGHYHNPFAALLAPETTEEHGDAYGFNVVYSGNYAITAEVDAFGLTRIICGLNHEGFEWKLDAGEEFYTPETVLVYSAEGLGGMSRALHRFYREHLINQRWARAPRPVLVNNWEATYFAFDDEKLVSIAKDAAELGIDMLVMDDGWFGKRNDDRSSLGDWNTNEEKLKGGLPSLVSRVNEAGVDFGIWFEPEMASRDSELYRRHPEWILHTEGRKPSIARHQYVLDLTRQDVCDYIYDSIASALNSANIKYIKWDFNRNLTEVASASLPSDRQGEVGHRYVLGLYSILERLTHDFPNVLLEGCSSGGGRYDPALLYYFPQYWTSDDTDPIERLNIQYGTSMAYPASTMSCHVSASPNHQTGRRTSFETRGNVAFAGTFGYELDLNKLTEHERELVREQVSMYKKYSHIVNNGDLYRLIPPTEDVTAWEYVSEDGSEALVTFVAINARIAPVYFLHLRGLDPDAVYVDNFGRRFFGSTLMNAGLNMTRGWHDAESTVIYFKKEG